MQAVTKWLDAVDPDCGPTANQVTRARNFTTLDLGDWAVARRALRSLDAAQSDADAAVASARSRIAAIRGARILGLRNPWADDETKANYDAGRAELQTRETAARDAQRAVEAKVVDLRGMCRTFVTEALAHADAMKRDPLV
jgi:hypothetical protein